MSSQPTAQHAIFSTICYFITSSTSSERAEKLSHVLNTNGATVAAGELQDPKLNIIISNSNKFEGWDLISSREGINIVTEQWVERSLVLGKIQSPSHYSADPAMIFSGITACATDLPSGDLEVLTAGITALGGQWRIGLTKEVTHLFALNTGSAKYATAMHFQPETGVKIIVPHWFDDAVRLGMGGLPTRAYEWPEPEVIRGVDLSRVGAKGKGTSANLEKDSMKRSMYASAALFTAAMGQPSPSFNADIPMASIMKSTPPQVVTSMVWEGRKFVLSRTLELYNGRRESLQLSIERAGGVVIRYEGDEEEPEPLSEADKKSDMELGKKERIRRRNEAEQAKNCDVLITRWRYGRAYVQAFQAGKTIGTLAWLFLVHSSGVFTNPMDQILHYPIPKRPIEGFSNHLISLTNYTGEAREYLKKLIGVMGAKFTPSMTGSNTALIAATQAGTKAVKAQAWSIPVVNHTWLEDCFVQWRNLTTATEKYIVFPPGVDFSEVLGDRGVGVGKGVEAEVDDLASMVFEEDEVVEMHAGKDDSMHVDGSIQDEQEDIEMHLDMPNGTAGSAKEVELSLQDHEEEDHPDPKSSRRNQANNMDVDIVPSLTKRQDVHHRDTLQSPGKGQPKTKPPVTPLRSPAKPVTYSSKTKQARRKIIHESSDDEEEEDDEEDARVAKKVPTGTKSKPHPITKVDETLSHSDQEDEEPVVKRKEKLPSKSKSKTKAVSDTEIIDLSDSDDNLHGSKQARKSQSRTRAGRESDAEQEEEVVIKSPPKPKASKSKPTSKLSEKAPPKPRVVSKPTRGSRRIKTTPESEDEDEAVEAEVAPIVEVPSARLKSKRKANAELDEEEAAEDDENAEEELPKFKIGKPTGKRNATEAEAKKDRSGKTKLVQTSPESDDDDQPLDELIKRVTPKKSSHSSPEKVSNSKNKARTGAFGLADAINMAVTPVTGTGLLTRTKADARTRIKKKVVKEVAKENSDEEDEENTAKSSKITKGRKNGAEGSDAEENESEKGKVKTASKGKSRAVTKPKQQPNTRPTNRTKPRRFHSSDEEEDPSDVDDDDDDDSLPAAPHLLTKSESRKKGKAKALPKDDTDPPILTKQKSTKNGKSVASSSKQTVAVVISTPQANKRAAKALLKEAAEEEQEESDEAMEDPPKSKNSPKRTASKPGSKVKAISPSSGEEAPPKSRTGRSKQETSKKGSAFRRPAAHERKPSASAEVVTDDTPSAASVAPPRRNAAAKARQHLHDTLMPDLVNFEAQMKKSKGKGRRSTSSYGAFALDSEPDVEVELGGKRKKGRVDEEDMPEDDVPEVVENPKKKRRLSDQNEGKIEVRVNRNANGKRKAEKEENLDSGRIVLLTTQISLSEEVIKTLAKMGVTITSRPGECTHLIAPHIVRTEKFLCALAQAPFIVTAKWATASAASKKLLPEKDFLLSNESPDKKYDIDLADALSRARANHGKLLEGKTFYITPKVQVDKKLLKNVVGACGGTVSLQSPTLRIISNNTESRFVISCKEDQSIWRPIADQDHKIYTHELLLMGVLKQQMEWDNKDFLVNA